MSVYFIASAGRIKIGFSRNVKGRVHTLATASPYPVDLIAEVAGERELETAIHTRLAAFRLHGEWFDDCAPVRCLLADLQTLGPAAVGLTHPAPQVQHASPSLAVREFSAVYDLAAKVLPDVDRSVAAEVVADLGEMHNQLCDLVRAFGRDESISSQILSEQISAVVTRARERVLRCAS